jgi:hypothetical protein
MYAFNIEKIKNLVSVILVNLLHLLKKIGCLYLGSLIVAVENLWFRMRLNSMQIEFQLLKLVRLEQKSKSSSIYCEFFSNEWIHIQLFKVYDKAIVSIEYLFISIIIITHKADIDLFKI